VSLNLFRQTRFLALGQYSEGEPVIPRDQAICMPVYYFIFVVLKPDNGFRAAESSASITSSAFPFSHFSVDTEHSKDTMPF
jgi:hypothetical protein